MTKLASSRESELLKVVIDFWKDKFGHETYHVAFSAK
jgi:hypothetical protein